MEAAPTDPKLVQALKDAEERLDEAILLQAKTQVTCLSMSRSPCRSRTQSRSQRQRQSCRR